MDKNINESLVGQSDTGSYKYNADELAAICNLDNHHKDENSEFPTRTISSGMIIETYHGLKDIMNSLGCDPVKGIVGTKADTDERKRVYGPNFFPPPHIKSLYELVMENFDDKINLVLLAAAGVSLAIGLLKEGFPEGMIEGSSICIALVIIIVVNSGNNYISERRLADLVKLADKQQVAVYRNNEKTISIDSEDLVVGDLYYFEKGEKIPADSLIISGQDVTCIEGELTGEPDAFEKVPVTESNFNQEGLYGTLYAKSLVSTGFGTALVMAVGPKTVAGIITAKTQTKTIIEIDETTGEEKEVEIDNETLLQKKLAVMADKIGNVGIACAVLTFFSLCVRVAVEMLEFVPCGCANIFACQVNDDCEALTFEFTLENRLWEDVLETIIIAISVVVCAIPEGLPLAVVISLSYASKAMRDKNNLVRKLASAETMGGANHICSDKTGTLTLNQMTVMSLMTMNKVKTIANEEQSKNLTSSIFDGIGKSSVGQTTCWDTLIESIVWNSSARVEWDKDLKNAKGVVEPGYTTAGNVTEQGIFKFFKNQCDWQGLLDQKDKLTKENILCIIPFSSLRKRGSIVVRNPDLEGSDQEVRVYCKGAPDVFWMENVENSDVVYPELSGVCTENGVESLDQENEIPSEISQLDGLGSQDTNLNLYRRSVQYMAKQAFRTILVTYRDMSMADFQELKENNNNFEKEDDRNCLEKNLTAFGIFGLQDPLRPNIQESIITCKKAGITVIMCTGDNIDTAVAISKNAGIINSEQHALYSRNSNELDEEQKKAQQYTCMTGKDFRNIVGGLQVKNGKETPGNMNKFREIKKYIRVLARSSPDDKYLLVTGIQLCKGVVAVTGDGSNDAPALTKADVGFAMNIAGTDIAKGASDIILLDDNFSSILVALEYGRNVYDNVRKFLQFQLSVNVVAMFIVFFGSVILKSSPLNAVQMLWVNLIMDTLGALALATEPPSDDILERAPYDKDAAIVTPIMQRNVFGHAFYQVIALVVVIFAGPGWLCEPYWEKCVQGATSEDSDNCEWNPFYVDGPYYLDNDSQDPVSLQWWAAKSLERSDFNQDALNKFICMNYGKDQDSTFDLAACVTDTTITLDDANYISPSNLEEYTQSQQLIHYTVVFQVFVFMQLFNQINARMLGEDEFNVFAGIFNNMLFVGVVIFTFVTQWAMVAVGGRFMKTAPLSMTQNLTCIAIGAGELLWGLVVKKVPTKYFPQWQLDDVEDKSGGGQGGSDTLKKSGSLSSSLKRQKSSTMK